MNSASAAAAVSAGAPSTGGVSTESVLRRVLVLDALSAGLLGAGLLGASGVLAEPFGTSVGFLRGLGAVLVGVAVLVAAIASRRPLWRPAVAGVIVLNLAWVVASLGVAAGVGTRPTALGVAADLAQALVVVAFVLAEFRGLRRLAVGRVP